MKLKEIEVLGFKSFFEKTNVNFKDGITAIVGPNGSGKSNISDAIRWVLGEQSIKTLRGNKMEDVIFAGTSKRKALGYAEVTIVFDNSEGSIPIEYEEVAITRRVFRSGESEFYINKNACRLKDIRELLMDTGIGKDGYSIIGQGKIDEILSNKSEDRRHIFEEAAGIVKYKSKKEESERKLLRTEDNLIRINDIVSELEKREKKLKKQAEKALEYEKIYEELKNKEISYINNNIKKIDENIKLTNNSKKYLENQVKEIKVKLNQIKSNQGKLDLYKQTVENQYKQEVEKRLKIEEKINEYKNKISILKEQQKYNKKDIDRISIENEKYQKNILKYKEDNEILTKELNTLEKDIVKTKDLHKLKENQYNNDLALLNKTKRDLELKKDNVLELYNIISEKKSELSSVESFNKNIEKRAYQLKDVLQKLNDEIKNVDRNRKVLNFELEKINKEKKELNIKLENLAKNILQLKNNIYKYEQEVKKLDIKLQTNTANYRLYNKMEDSYEGYYKGVKSILRLSNSNESLRSKIVGVVADLIRVEKAYELAISTSLGGNAQNIVTENQRDAKILIHELSKIRGGRITCLPLDTIKGKTLLINDNDRSTYKVLGLASELVSYNQRYKDIVESLLGRTVVVEDMDNAINLSNKYKNNIRIVTLKGDVINPGGSMTGGSHNQANSNIFSRKNEIDRIAKVIKEIKSNRNSIIEDYESCKLAYESTLNKKDDLEERLLELKYKEVELDNKLLSNNNEILRIKHQLSINTEENMGLEEETSEYKLREVKLREELNELESQLEVQRKNIKSLTEIISEEQNSIDEERDTISNVLIDINKKNSEIKRLESIIYNNNLQIEEIEVNLENNNLVNIKLEENIEKITEEISKIEEKSIKIVSDLSDITDIINNVENKIKEQKENEINLIRESQEHMDSINKFKNKLNDEELAYSKLNLSRENFLTQLYEKYKVNYIDILDLKTEQVSREEIDKIKADLEKMGSVNLAAKDEYKDLKGRLDFIYKQKSDLEQARTDLNTLIYNIERKMSKLFKESFDEINKNFKLIFKTLFNGGEAGLILEDDKNFLTSGIEIQAKPPGKKLQNLSSLSGGERSLVAVALLFAILKMKPSPFCVLDEIDAALDEANIGRYTSYLQDISEETQFIIITHRKTTMEMADVLYGVTMEEEGVSKIVSVELKDFKN